MKPMGSTLEGARLKSSRSVIDTMTPMASSTGQRKSQRVAVVIPAKDESERIGATVQAARAIPYVDMVLVVDDGSSDKTQDVARQAGAVVIRHPNNRGKASAMETGASVVAMRDSEDDIPRLMLFIDADLGESAVNTAPLITPVLNGEADMSIALLPPQQGAAGHGFVVGKARKAIGQATGWVPVQPLSGMRCLTREAFNAALPLAHGWGVETGLTLDLLNNGFDVVEIPCDIRHRPTGKGLKDQLHRASQYKDVSMAVLSRKLKGLGRKHKRRNKPRTQRPN